MSERIKELAEQQAGAILMDLIMPDSGMPERVKWNVGITTEHLEKFAELLLKECILRCNEALVPHTGQPSMTHNYAVGLCQDKIKEHFGVEQ